MRHAPVREDGGCIYGQKDLGCDTSDRVVFEAVGKDPAAQRGLVRKQSEADASDRGRDLGRRLSKARKACRTRRHLPNSISANGRGMNRAAFLASRPDRQPLVCARSTNPRRAARALWISITALRGAIERISAEHAGRDVIAVAHGGTIKAAIGLALGGQPEKGLAFDYRQLLGDAARSSRKRTAISGWRIPMVNQQPWIADASHNAMHQPAGPGGRPADDKLA